MKGKEFEDDMNLHGGGEVPGFNIVEQHIDRYPGPSGLDKKADQFKKDNPKILDYLKRKELDAFMAARGHGTAIFIGAAITAAAVVGAIEVYKHAKKSSK